jgi:hypothetical protein
MPRARVGPERLCYGEPRPSLHARLVSSMSPLGSLPSLPSSGARRWARWLQLVPWLLVAILVAPEAAARKVRVRGGTKIFAQATFVRDRSVLELRGQLVDDGRQPLEGAWIELRSRGFDLGDARACESPRAKVAPIEGGLRVQTAPRGEICLRWPEAPDEGTIAVRFEGDGYHGGADLAVAFDRKSAQKLGTTLRFDPRPVVVELDEEQLVISGVIDLALSTAHASRQDLAVELRDERGKTISSAQTAGDGKVRLLVDPAKLDGPGAGRLVLTFAGNDQLAEAHDDQPITRRITVGMRLAEEVEPADPGDTATLELLLDTRRGAVDGGVVEALLGGASVGSAPVVDGKATLVVALDPKLRAAPILSLRYLPSSPFYKPGQMLSVEVPIAPPSIALRVILTFIVLAAAAWVTISWRRSRELPKLSTEGPVLAPGVHVVRKHAKDDGKWDGDVIDAHDGAAIAGATVRVRAPTLDGDDAILEIVCDERGRFAFELSQRPDGAEIVAEASKHSEQRKALPPAGTLRIALITRRRALVRRFVQWAQFRGAPYDAKPEPTPAHVRAVASRRDRDDVERWAGAVERAAFGPGEVDEHVEREVRDAEPGP